MMYVHTCACGWVLRTEHLGAFRSCIARHTCGDGPPCAHCGRLTVKYRVGRGLCKTCLTELGPEGRLDYERRTFTADELLDEWTGLRLEGYTVRQAAARIGVTYDALDQALVRAKRRGDPRAVRPGTAAEWNRKKVAA